MDSCIKIVKRRDPRRISPAPRKSRGSAAGRRPEPLGSKPPRTILAAMETIAKYAALASSAFIFIPAGRDMISYGTFLLPGEENIRP